MTELTELIAQRDALDKQITVLQKQEAEAREEAWRELDYELSQRIAGRWRKCDLIFDLPDVMVTLVNRLDGVPWMTVTWGSSSRAEFHHAPPVKALLAFIDALKDNDDRAE